MLRPWPTTVAATASESDRARAARLLAVVAVALAVAMPAAAEGRTPAQSTFSCIVNGKKVVSDRVIPECTGIEQRELNADGSLKRVVPPTPTDDERAELERQRLLKEAERSAANDAIRRDRNLMLRYPDEAAHRKGRAKALDEFRVSVKNYDARIALLKVEKKKLADEAEFYPPPAPLPSKLKQAIDANDAALEAQQGLVQNQQAEIARINAMYDVELVRLRKLWAGAPAGSLGPPPGPQATLLPTTASAGPLRAKVQ